MPFRELPWRLRAYIIAHPVMLTLLLAVAMQQPRPHHWWLVALLMAVTAVFSTWKVELTVLQGRMTLTFAVVCLALLLEHLQASVLCGVVGAVVGTLTRPAKGSWKVELTHPPIYRLVFNIGNSLIACILAGLAHVAVLQAMPPGGTARITGLIAFTTTYFVINTWGVSLAIAYQQGLPCPAVWQQNFLWTCYCRRSTSSTTRTGYTWTGCTYIRTRWSRT
jgi:hypothetical protein